MGPIVAVGAFPQRRERKIWTPDQVASATLHAYFDVAACTFDGSDRLTSFPDLSGRGAHGGPGQGVDANRPTLAAGLGPNGYDAIAFDSSNDYIGWSAGEGSALASTAESYTIGFGCRPLGVFSVNEGPFDSQLGRLICCFNASGGNAGIHDAGLQRSCGAPIPGNEDQGLIWRLDAVAGKGRIYRNGLLLGVEFDYSGLNISAGANITTVGSSSGLGVPNCEMRLWRLFLFEGAIDLDEIPDANSWIQSPA